MNNWSQKDLQDRQRSGKIRGYKVKKNAIKNPETGKLIPPEKPAAIIWLDWNLQYWCNEHALTLEMQYEFNPHRKFASDYAITALKVLIEYEGGIFMPRGGHNSPSGIQRDIEKYALAESMGYRVIRLTVMSYKTVLQTLNEMVK